MQQILHAMCNLRCPVALSFIQRLERSVARPWDRRGGTCSPIRASRRMSPMDNGRPEAKPATRQAHDDYANRIFGDKSKKFTSSAGADQPLGAMAARTRVPVMPEYLTCRFALVALTVSAKRLASAAACNMLCQRRRSFATTTKRRLKRQTNG
jgi:hypothetical protein